jgi:hypothetical protein
MAKVKKIRMPIGGKDTDLADMFNQMLGADSVNVTIAYPKYTQLKQTCETIAGVLSLIANSPFMCKTPAAAAWRDELVNYVNSMRAATDTLFKINYDEYVWNLELLSKSQKDLFNQAYIAVKKSSLVADMISCCDKLTPYKTNFDDQDTVNHLFIMNMAGVEWMPFSFAQLNLKEIFSMEGVGDNTVRFFMITVHKVYHLTRKVWDIVSSPDIDVNQFVDVIMTNIEYIQKRPELSRCKKAFAKIRSSVNLLKDRFGSYYRDFIRTKESTIIFEHFILDVSSSTNVDPQEVAQFRIIIDYYRKIAQQQSTNPKIKAMFEKVEATFKEMEAAAPNLSKESEPMPDPEPEKPPIPAVEPTRDTYVEKSVNQLLHEINSSGRKKKKH